MRTLFVVPLLLLASIASAQVPQLLATEKPGEKPHPITLTKADVQLFIAGRLCQTTMTLTFHNDADRLLEGELVFPLPENATVCGYGLDVGGQIVDAVTIEKEKARVVFESESRRGIDPGIVEQVQGNNFRTRVHPIPAKGTRTVRVQYVGEAVARGDLLVYNLPLHWPGATPETTLRIESVSSQAPKVEALPGMKFESQDNHHIAQQAIDQSTLKGEVVATLPAEATPAVVVESRAHTASVENLDPKISDQLARTEFYFLANQTPLPDAAAAAAAKPRHIAIAWDASLSRAKLDHAREFDFLKKHLATLGDVLVEVIPFRNVAESEHTFMVRNGDSTEVLKFLAGLQYDGGTSLSSVNFAPHAFAEDKPRPDISYYLLFTDGLSDLGPELPPNVTTPVFPVSIDPRSNHNVLRRLAATSGGQYLNLQTLSTDQALAAMTEHPFSLLSIDADPKEIADLYPKLPQPVHGPVTIAGRLLAPKATLTLNYGRDGRVTQRVPITVTRDGATHTGLVSRYWAQLKLADLSIATERNAAEITDLGKQFNLVTPYTSMIVLETLDQYLRHKIVPPRSRGDIYAQFMQQIEQRQAVAQKEEQAKIDRVLAMWNQRLEWWNKDFSYPADFKYKEVARDEAGLTLGGIRGGTSSSASAPATRGFAEGRQLNRAVPAATPAPRPSASASHTVTIHVEDLRNTVPEAPEFAREAFFGESDAKARKSDESSAAAPRATISLKPWSPDTPYLKALQSAPADKRYSVYLEQRKSYESSPAFYLDCADFFAATDKPLALRILTNIPELGLDDGRLLRIAAHRLQQLGQLDLAIDLFETVARLQPEEPQSHRDLALALAERAERELPLREAQRRLEPGQVVSDPINDFQRALNLLHKVVMNHWDRFDEIEVIALTEANHILARVNSLSAQDSAFRTIHNPFDPRLVKLLDPDLRIVMTWDTDNTDIDLHVTEPTGETCVYNHNRTTIGGALSKDFTQGYGPEEYLLKKLMPGEYKIQAHFYGNRDQRAVGPTTVQATVITHYGRPDEHRQSLTLRLKEAKDMVDIGTVTLK